MELIQDVRPGNRAPAFRRIASAQVQLGGLTEAVVWVRALRDPFERCFALMGAAQGLWYAKEEAAVEQN